MAVQTVTPVAKPGTEMTAYALPTPDGVTRTAAALAVETAVAKPGEQVSTQAQLTQTDPATTQVAAAAPLEKQGRTAIVAQADVPQVETAQSRPIPQIPEGMVMAAMESDFDTGEPVGLETLVAKNMIVPTQRPGTTAMAFAGGQAMPASIEAASVSRSDDPELNRLISFYAKLNAIPEALVHRVVKRESTYNPKAYHAGNYGLMQIRYNTAKGLGYEGPAEGLFDAETNLKYATKYLAGAWRVAENQNDQAVRLYASGYYYHAKRKGLLDELDMR